jgi:cytochrome c-type biogenesis protein CcmH/NrfF
MKNRTLAVIPLLLTLLMLAPACSSAIPITITLSPSTATSTDAAALVQERCTVCHSLTRVENARYSAADWKMVVDTMIAKGAHITPEEEAVVVNWLAANYGP